MSNHTLDVIRERTGQYVTQADVIEGEKWKRDHDRAMECMDFELLLQHGLSIFEAINLADEKIRRLSRRGNLEYTAEIDEAITAIYRWWQTPCEKITGLLVKFENEGFEVENSEAFRSACREVSGILTEDSQFFGDELVKTRDQAIEDHRAGLCEQA